MDRELGVTDYLHELELWREALDVWLKGLPEAARKHFTPQVARLLTIADRAALRARLLRKQMGLDDPLPPELSQYLDGLEVELTALIWRMAVAESSIVTQVALASLPMPPRVPRGRIRVEVPELPVRQEKR